MTENSNGVVILITLLNILVYKLRKLEESHQKKHLPLSVRPLCRRFSLTEIQSATNNFSEELVIGKGGFGNVYKGIIDFKDRIVAMKRSKSMSKQGRKDFLTEIEMLSQFQHSHLVSLVGYCDENEEMILVYSYMSSGSLADHLHKRVRKGETTLPSLSWVQRLKICIGAAQGLNYLHTGTGIENRVIHRDVKTSNILLDENLEAKISDFGLSIKGPANQTCTYVSTRVRGTPGYLDPFYVDTRRITRKADVYSFGVVLFEALCGRPALDQSLDEEKINLAKWAQHCFKEGLLDGITDPKIKGDISSDSLSTYVDVAVKCLHNKPKLRPTMAEVVVSLESALTLQEKSTHYTLVEIIPTDYSQEFVDSSMLELKNNNHKQEHEFTGKGNVNVSDVWHRNNQFTSRTTFTKRVGSLFSVTTWALAGNKDAKRSRYSNDLLSFSSRKPQASNCQAFVAVDTSVPARPRRQEVVLQSPTLKKFKFNDLKVATRNFHSTSVIGEGGFGQVFKCWINEHTFAAANWGTGQPLAVKRLRVEGHQGLGHREWLTEIDYLDTLCHPNIVKVIGYCSKKKHRFIVYEFMSQGSLDKRLHKRDSHFQPLSWNLRIRIALGAAKGLAYLHSSEARVIYRDFKASNILLDSNYNAKLSDFGLAKDGPGPDYSHHSTMIAGTMGYIAPEYMMSGYLTMKCDIYGYGVVLLEILTGRRVFDRNFPDEEGDLVSWVQSYLTSNRDVVHIMDKHIEGQYTVEAALRGFSIALKCVSVDPKSRPEAKEVVKELEEIQQMVSQAFFALRPRRQEDVLQSPTLKSFTFDALNLATREFHSDVQLGNHQYGQVYKGWINEHTFAAAKWGTGRAIAVKRFNQESSQGHLEWLTEIDYLDTLSHPNIVKLIGYCSEKSHGLLVYEFMSEGSLKKHLYKSEFPNLIRHDQMFSIEKTSLPSLSWVQRLKICIGAAQGLNYLHTGTGIDNRVIHRDVKTSNILLDENLAAKLSGFGLSIRGPENQTCEYVSSRVRGTPGYLDPSYLDTRRITSKADVYSFGVVLFEVLCGRPALDQSLDEEQINLAKWAQNCFNEGRLDEMTDPKIKGDISFDSLSTYVDAAVKCLHYQPKLRPTMAEIVVSLESALTLQEKSTHYTLVEIIPTNYS